MKKEYIITEDELLTEYGLPLANYTIDTTAVSIIIYKALGKAITRILHLNDNIKYESGIEKLLDEDSELVKPFKKLQHQIVYNFVFLGEDNVVNGDVDDIITADMRLGAINGFQKNLYRR